MNFTYKAIKWYAENKRDLPWRSTIDPYKLWLSEIILQQTRVDQGKSYYLKFIKNYPTIDHLAKATEDNILKDWQGLGYYSRARNLHFTAKHISNNLQGNFPRSYDELLKLKGVGEYTASAIASMAFNIPQAVVDGNVYRLFSRYFGVSTPIDTNKGKNEFKALAQELIDNDRPADFNQAIMDLGAIICVPKNPLCKNCPLQESCFAYKNDTISDLPVKSKKIKLRDRFFNYLVIIQNDEVYINKREEKDIWQNLHDFPLIETSSQIETKELLDMISEKNLISGDITVHYTSKCYKHLLSHQRIHAVFTELSLGPNCILKSLKAFPIPKKNLEKFAIPKLLDNYLRNESKLLYLF